MVCKHLANEATAIIKNGTTYKRAFGEAHSTWNIPRARNIPGEWPFGEPFPWKFTVDSRAPGNAVNLKSMFRVIPGKMAAPADKVQRDCSPNNE